MEVAGFAISIVGLAGQLLQGSLACYHFLETVQSLSTDLSDLRFALEFERLAFEKWAKYWLLPITDSKGVEIRRARLCELDPEGREYAFVIANLGRLWTGFGELRKQLEKLEEGGKKSKVEGKKKKVLTFFRSKKEENTKVVAAGGTTTTTFVLRESTNLSTATTLTTSRPASPAPDSPELFVKLSTESQVSTLSTSDLQSLQLRIAYEAESFKANAENFQKSVSVAKKAEWAFSEKKNLEGLLTRIKNHNKMLMKLLPCKMGPDKALRTDESEFDIPSKLPFNRNDIFCGRDDILHRLQSSFHASSDQNPIQKAVLNGLGGIGKSSIALEYAYRYKKTYSTTLWIDVTSKLSMSGSISAFIQHLVRTYSQRGETYTGIAKRLRLAECLDENGQLKKMASDVQLLTALHEWLCDRENKSWLMIIDNMDDPDAVNAWPLLNTELNGYTIITTRRTDLAVKGCKIEAKEFDAEAAVGLLLNDRMAYESAPEKSARELAKKLGYLPLALAQARSYMARMQISVTKYLALFDKRFKEMAVRGGVEWSSEQGNRNQTVFSTWEISFASLSEVAKEVLTLCGFFDNSEILESFLEPVFKDEKTFNKRELEDLKDALEELLILSLAKRKTSEDAIWIHPVVHEWARARLEPKFLYQRSFEATIVCTHHFKYSKEITGTDWSREQKIWPHVKTLSSNVLISLNWDKLASQLDRQKAQSFIVASGKLGDMLYYAGRYKLATTILQSIIEALTPIASGEDFDKSIFHATMSLGINFYFSYDFTTAQTWLEKAVSHGEKGLGRKDAHVLEAINDLAMVYGARGHRDMPGSLEEKEEFQKKADALYEEAYEGRMELHGRDHPETLESISNIATAAFWATGKHTKALEWQTRAVEGFQRVLGPEHPDTARAIVQLANIYEHVHSLAHRADFYQLQFEWAEKARVAMEKSLGPFHHETIEYFMGYAEWLMKAGNFNEALEMVESLPRSASALWGAESDAKKEIESAVAKIRFVLDEEEILGLREDDQAPIVRIYGGDKNDLTKGMRFHAAGLQDRSSLRILGAFREWIPVAYGRYCEEREKSNT